MPSENGNSDHQSKESDSPSPPAGSRFVTTSWTMVLKATDANESDARPALANLCEAYWYPLYAFARRKGHTAADAEDLTQSFFAELLEKDRLAMSDPQRGRFRTFLLSALDNYLKNQHRDAQAQKRGGLKQLLSLDFETAEDKYSQQPFHELTAQKIFDRSWAITLLNQVFNSLQQQYIDSGKAKLFTALRAQIVGDGELSYKEIASSLGMKEGAIKVAVHRLRERYGQQLRLQIAKTVDDPAQVDEELKYLFQAIAQN